MTFLDRKPIAVFGLLLMLLAGCDISTTPYDGKSNEEALETVQGLEAATRGNYQIFVGGSGYYYYTKHLFYMNEFPGDNVSLSGTTTDPLFYAYNYGHSPNMGNVETLWRDGYAIIQGANRVIEAIGEESSDKLDQIKGENLFLRALVHFQLVNNFGRPYTQNPEQNLGIPIVDFTDIQERPGRATVAEVYDFIVKDLEQAASLMNEDKNSSYASTEVAYALLSRVHLYMENNEQAIEYANRVINSGRYELVDTQTYREYFTLPNENNPETIFAIKHTKENDHGFGNIGSMYLRSDDGVGWGEMYASKSYRDVLGRYEEDARHAFIEPQYVRNEDGSIQKDENGDPVLEERNGYPKYYVNKFSYQEGIVSLSSPVILRLAEMYLNRAEANAKLGNDQQAIDDVNTIRKRAGLSGNQLYSVGDLKNHDSIMDVVMEERRLEFAFEGQRKFDVFRNGRTMQRDYPGTHLSTGEAAQVIQPDEPRVVFYIPENEIELNGSLEQNP
ncbi:RagB/SusD family nutrient uptake outer membrane protein [Fodinibius salsisoli]|uniref:RagB/SusD family nutrient uptake outer membrane protein n=1 Tax=Fodinibius salsisoli TaxID=2820877 RepID=A0ABT3PQ59_9BACT|nr:RagB/SusD family nutrient uptake outer membrane protein [Fodinibius salsisoli]MCW9707994.1 RagB/SusD family nutrient uptake outer membrane protein [Fodinibius salsisoli]